MTKTLAVTVVADVTGAEQSLLNIAPLMRTRGIEMALATVPGGVFEKRWRAAGLEFCPLTVPDRQGFRPNSGVGYSSLGEYLTLPWRSMRAVSRVRRAARRSAADVIHSNRLITHLDCVLAARLSGKSSIIELHDIVSPGVGRWALGVAALLSGRTVAVSGAVRDQVPRWARKRVVVIPQSVDLARFDGAHFVDAQSASGWRAELAADPDEPIIVAVGRIDPEKGLGVLIRAVADMRRAGSRAQLALVGSPSKDADGGHLRDLRGLGESLLGQAFRWIPQVDDLPGVLHAVDVLACPSYAEPFGMIILEAQVCGVPVVASAAGGPLEFVIEGETGLLVPPADVTALARALESLLGDEERRRDIASAGRAHAKDEYNADLRADRFAALYEAVTG